VTLFAYGRTIWCTCGARVAADLLQRDVSQRPELRFLADEMLGRLGRWLRLLGFDCETWPGGADGEMVRCAVDEARILLTRDRRLRDEWHVSDLYLVDTDRTFDQLIDVLRAFDLMDSIRLFARCSVCNHRLHDAERHQAVGRVPARILETHERFRRCAHCERLYWEGSPTERIRRIVEQLRGADRRSRSRTPTNSTS